jgi:hypothetical protein
MSLLLISIMCYLIVGIVISLAETNTIIEASRKATLDIARKVDTVHEDTVFKSLVFTLYFVIILAWPRHLKEKFSRYKN